MKKIMSLLLALILCALVFAGCKKEVEPSADGEENITENTDPADAPDENADPDPETVPADPEDPAFNVEDDGEEAEENGGEDENAAPADDLFDKAFALIDHPLAELIEAIGEPNDSSYASSCIGAGQDGELYYDDFTVCTYLENGEETVVDVYK